MQTPPDPQPPPGSPEWARQRADEHARLYHEAHRPIDRRMLDDLHRALAEKAEEYGRLLTAAFAAADCAHDPHASVRHDRDAAAVAERLDGRLPLWEDNIRRLMDFLRDVRSRRTLEPARVGPATADSAHGAAILLYTRAAATWRRCEEAYRSDRSYALSGVPVGRLFLNAWVTADVASVVDVESALRLEHGLARSVLRGEPKTGPNGGGDASPPSAGTTPTPASTGAADPAVFRRAGGVWHLAYKGTSVHVRDLRGYAYIARLLAAPDTPMHAGELVAAADGRAGVAGLTTDTGEAAFDPAAWAAARRASAELSEDLASARRAGDAARVAAVRAQMGALGAAMAGAKGKGGQDRRIGSAAEKVRKSVQGAIDRALRALAGLHEPLRRHLDASITTGTLLTYVPPEPVRWEL